MSELFISVLNMSLTASYVILFVIIMRLPLKKAPKFLSYAIWSVVAFRLIIPFSFESIFSLMPHDTNAVPIPHDIIYQQSPQINSGIEVVDSIVSESLPVPTVGASVNPLQIYTEIGAYIWALGIIALLVYSLGSTLILKKQLKSAQLIEKNVFEAKNLKTPFVLGFVRPKIYLPVGLNEEERGYILLHEQTHIQRKDHIIKSLAFLILSIHWFNPLVWVAFILMNKDMEFSCDERVLKNMGANIKKPYANSLLSLATGKHILNGSPLAFGEGNVKGRINNVLNYKKPKFWLIIFLIIIVMVVGIGLITNPKTVTIGSADELLEARTKYIGDNSAVGKLIGLLAVPEGMQYDHFKLHTNVHPYTVEIVYSASSETLRYYDTFSIADDDIVKPFRKNALLLLSLIDNADQIRATITDGKHKLGFINAREWADYTVGRDVRDYAESSEKLLALIEMPLETSVSTKLKPTAPKVSFEQSLGADMPELDYASDDIVIFHGYFGLFVFDLDSQQLIRSLNLEPIDCQVTQGDNYCDVSVSKDGNTVHLHPIESKNMYIYTVSSHTLQEVPYQPMEECFSSVPTADVIDSTEFGIYSYNAARFDTGEYGYLRTSDWKLGSLTYVRGDKVYSLFNEKGSKEINILSAKPVTYETVNNLDGVNMTVKEGTVSSTGLIVVFENNSDKQCTYGEYFTLEKKNNGSWHEVPVAIDGDYGFNDIGYDLASGDNREWKVEWDWLYGNLNTGEYRIVKDILVSRSAGDYDKYYLTAEFVVD